VGFGLRGGQEAKVDRQTQLRLARELFNLIDCNGTSQAESFALNPVTHYTCVAHLAREQARLFRAVPMMVGLSSELPCFGDYLTDDRCGVPIAVVRLADGGLSAFINVCRHRGARVLEDRGTLAGSMVCPYHGWVYDLAGHLKTLAPADDFQGLTCAERNLTRLVTHEQHGLIWATPMTGPALEPMAPMGSLAEEIASYHFETFALYRRVQLHKFFNWKMVIETFLENWHFPFVHRRTVLPIFLSSLSLFEAFGRHGRLIMPRRSILQMRDEPVDQWNLLKHSLVIYWLFPNTLLLWQGDHLETWQVFPDQERPERCMAQVSLYTPQAATSARECKYWDKNMALLLETVDGEDFEISKRIQCGLRSGAQEHLTFGRHEPALQHFHRQIWLALEEGPAPAD
jgi:phenylpropionate dioxygenase-like ring-hydroxylating dioxygenase large terminal subunit